MVNDLLINKKGTGHEEMAGFFVILGEEYERERHVKLLMIDVECV